jgi:hypothetical protein
VFQNPLVTTKKNISAIEKYLERQELAREI